MYNLIMLPKNDTENSRQYAYRLLRYNIMNLRLLPGQTLNENEICKTFIHTLCAAKAIIPSPAIVFEYIKN